MKVLKRTIPAVAVLVAALGLQATADSPRETPFPLTQAVPGDVFLVTAERPDPERSFLDDYWAEVRSTFWQSGVLEDLTALVLDQVPEPKRPEMRRVVDRVRALVLAVDWSALRDGETVFAERLREPVLLPGGGLVMQPDAMVLLRADPDVAAETFARLQDLLRAAAEEVGTLAGLPLELEETTLHDTRFVAIDLLQMVDEAPELRISVGLRDDVLVFTYGRGIRAEVAELLAGHAEAGSIADNPRFARALEELPSDIANLEFVEFRNLRSGLERVTRRVFALIESKIDVEDHQLNAVREGEVYDLTRRALVPYRAGHYDEALELTHQAHDLDPTDTIAMFNLACLYALKGDRPTALDWLAQAVEGGFHAPRAIAEDADLTSLRGEPRYAEILGRATLAARADSLGWVATARALVDRAFLPIEMLDASATGRKMEGHALRGESVTRLAPDAGQNPFYGVAAARAGIADFERYLPVETTSFCVSSGIDFTALYGYVEDSLAEAGEPGRRALEAWTELQERLELDLRKELAWIDGAAVRTSLRLDGEDAWVWRMKVLDDDLARERLELLVEKLPVVMAELAAEKPMLAMLTPRTSPTAHEELPGFHDVAVGMMAEPAVCGVRDGWFVLGSSAEAAVLAEKTAAGDHPTVAGNPELMQRAMLPDGPVDSASFSDHRGTADEIAAILTAVSGFGGMAVAQVPDPEAREVLTRVFGIVAKLPRVVAKVDFYEFSAQATTLDGEAWRKRFVTYYVPPERRAPPAPAEH